MVVSPLTARRPAVQVSSGRMAVLLPNSWGVVGSWCTESQVLLHSVAGVKMVALPLTAGLPFTLSSSNPTILVWYLTLALVPPSSSGS